MVRRTTSAERLGQVLLGVRLASFFWTQSLIRDDIRRTTLYALEPTIQSLLHQHGSTTETVVLSNHYHNLLPN